MRRLGFFVLLTLLTACGHNYPVVDLPNSISRAPSARVYVDINGTLYPRHWRSSEIVGETSFLRSHSLYAAVAGDPSRRARIDREEDAYLAEIRTLAADAERAFVFLVGFNTDQQSTAVQLRAMQDVIGLTSRDIAVDFYWDGYSAAFGVDAARIWFWGSGSSQVAGQRGLRRVLNALGDREIYIVSYSRGASVVLSALSDPSYSPRFKTNTERLDYLGPGFLSAPPLADGKAIRVVMMAPAIGEPDFWADRTGEEPHAFRAFPDRVRSIRYSINPNDYVLTKLGSGLAGHFNATDLGATAPAGRDLDCHYRILQGYPVANRFGHDIRSYIGDLSFATMLRDSGLGLDGEPARAPSPISRRDC